MLGAVLSSSRFRYVLKWNSIRNDLQHECLLVRFREDT